MEKFEQRLALEMLVNVMRAARRGGESAYRQDQVIRSVCTQVGLAVGSLPRGRYVGPDWDEINIADSAQRHELTELFRENIRHLGRPRSGATEKNLRRLVRYFGLDRIEARILGGVVRSGLGEPWEELMRGQVHAVRARSIAEALGLSLRAVHERLRPTSTLCRTGLVTVDSDGDVNALPRLAATVALPLSAGESIVDWLLPPPVVATLTIEDFDHIRADVSFARRLLEGALAGRAAGVHVMLHGSPGTGKTELAKSLAANLGVRLMPVGEVDANGDEPDRRDRLGAYRLAQHVLSSDRQSLILFDEAEDLFDGESSTYLAAVGIQDRPQKGSRAYLHRMLEQAPVPTIWTTNRTVPLGTAVLRRMTYAIEVGQPGPDARFRIWRRTLEECGMEMDEATLRHLAAGHEDSPALVTTAVRAAHLANGGASEISRTLSAMGRLVGDRRPAPRMALEAHDPALVNADTDLLAIEARLVGCEPAPAVSFCLSGLPGTGKSAWIRHLAGRMGLEVLEKRASDLLGPYVGMSEKAIADAFAEARQSGSFLIIDEADSLLGDRREAIRSWEISQVNELLTCMERHDRPFAITTNLVDRIDPAASRRFVFKIRFDFLTREQACAAFRHFFDLQPPTELNRLSNLTLGDFAVVRRRAALLGETGSANWHVAALTGECEAKPGSLRAIGFPVA